MEHQAVREYLLNKPNCLLDTPFGPEVEVFKVKGKMFATLSLGQDKRHFWMNLKCDPDEALALRDIFESVIAGYHMNKKHWNTVILDGSIPQGEVERMIDNSFLLVVQSLPKRDRVSVEVHL
ncbi:MmcQ/YjbR family DNA-binding protein [Ferrimonas kyonanensis]|uniref:MmcQ/YjbR family DNA-binding protein n=1 Tax=Ferrimonas kyonanensis TaxID=364763 RepID=UPI0004121677|nr:MmcQ/YjbR family DNA-binding protein [Ferrimonas kyonanensis]